MASAYVASLITARDTAAVQLAELMALGQPDNSLDGESYQWGKEKNDLIKRIEDLNRMIAMAGGGFEIRSTGKS